MNPSSTHPYWDSQDTNGKTYDSFERPILTARLVHVEPLYPIFLLLLGLPKHRLSPSGCMYEGDTKYDTL